METATAAPSRAARARRWGLWGFLVGAVVTVPLTVLALTTPAVERVFPYLVPGPRLLQPLLDDVVADWPGAVNVAVAAAANGVAYALVAGAAGAVLTRARHRGGPAVDHPAP